MALNLSSPPVEFKDEEQDLDLAAIDQRYSPRRDRELPADTHWMKTSDRDRVRQEIKTRSSRFRERPLIRIDFERIPPVGELLCEFARRIDGFGPRSTQAPSPATLKHLVREALYAPGDFVLPAEWKSGKSGLLRFVPGGTWGGDHAGPTPSEVMIIGKMPGREETAYRRSFIGPSGKLLQDKLASCLPPDYPIDDIYVTNIIKHMHPDLSQGDKKLPPLIQENGRHLLAQELLLVKPKYVLCVGADAAKELLGKSATITKLEGEIVEHTLADGKTKCKVMVVIHPAQVLREPGKEPQLDIGIFRFARLIQGLDVYEDESKRDYRVITTEAELSDWMAEVRFALSKMKDPILAVDAEWHGEHAVNKNAYLRSVQVSWGKGKAACIVLHRQGGKEAFDTGSARAIKLLKHKLFSGVRVCGHFFNADLEMLVHFGLDLRKNFYAPRKSKNGVSPWERTKTEGGFDTGLAAHAIDESTRYKLELLALRFTSMRRWDHGVRKWAEGYCKKHNLKADQLEGYGECPDDVLIPYSMCDVDATLRLYRTFQKMLDQDLYGLAPRKAFWRAMSAAPAIYEMNTTGLLIDRDRLDAQQRLFTKWKEQLEGRVRRWVQWDDLNFNSVYQVRELLFGEALNGKKDVHGEPVRIRPPKAKSLFLDPVFDTGKRPVPWEKVIEQGRENEASPSTGKTALSILTFETENETKKKFLRLFQDAKFIGHAVKSVLRPPAVDQAGQAIYEDSGHFLYESGLGSFISDDGRVRSHLWPTTETGRCRSFRPNLQNLGSSREERYQEIMGADYLYPVKACFKTSPGNVLVNFDYKQAELVVLAVLSNDQTMLQHVLRSKLDEDHPDYYDIHSSIAVKAFRLKCAPTKKGLESIGRKSLRNAAKCVVEGSFLQTSDGWTRVDDLARHLGVDQAERYRGSLQVLNPLSSTKIVGVYNGGVKPCVRVEAEGGFQLDSTRVHRYWVMNEQTGDFEFKLAEDLCPGDWVAVRTGEGMFGKNTKFPKIERQTRTSFKDISFPNHFDEAWAGFLGLYVSEGSSDPAGGAVQFSQAIEEDPQAGKEMVKLLRKVFGDRAKVADVSHEETQDQVTGRLSSVKLARWLATFFPGLQPERDVADFVLQWPKKLQAAFLRWAFEGDGSAKYASKKKNSFHVSYSSSSEKLIRKIQLMLLNFGIVSTVSSETRKDYPGRLYWSLVIHGNESRDTFVREIGFVSRRKNKRCRTKTAYARDTRVLPGQLQRLRELMPFIPSPVKEKCRECLREKARVNLNPTRLRLILNAVRARELTGESKEAYDALSRLLSLKLECRRVTKVEDIGEKQVYDVQTTDEFDHLVSYNGLLTHQTVAFGIAYGRQAKAIAMACRELGLKLTVEEAQRIIDTFLTTYSSLPEFFDQCRKRVTEPRWIASPFQRYRRFPYTTDFQVVGELERQAQNFPIQSAVADIVNQCLHNLYWYRVDHDRPNLYKICLQIHDAVLLEVPIKHLKEVVEKVIPMCSSSIPLYRCDLSGNRVKGAKPFYLASDVDIYEHYGQKMTDEDKARLGVPAELSA